MSVRFNFLIEASYHKKFTYSSNLTSHFIINSLFGG